MHKETRSDADARAHRTAENSSAIHRLNRHHVTFCVLRMTAKPLELLTVTEAARRIGACGNTLRRNIEKQGLSPDAFLFEGSNRIRSPLFVASSLPKLAKLVGVNPQILS